MCKRKWFTCAYVRQLLIVVVVAIGCMAMKYVLSRQCKNFVRLCLLIYFTLRKRWLEWNGSLSASTAIAVNKSIDRGAVQRIFTLSAVWTMQGRQTRLLLTLYGYLNWEFSSLKCPGTMSNSKTTNELRIIFHTSSRINICYTHNWNTIVINSFITQIETVSHRHYENCMDCNVNYPWLMCVKCPLSNNSNNNNKKPSIAMRLVVKCMIIELYHWAVRK